jgi:transcriptional antiterminator NusG
MAMRWYVVHAYSGYEKKVAAALKERIELHGMEDRFGDVLVPTEEVVEMRAARSARASASSSPATCWCRWSSTTKPGTW